MSTGTIKNAFKTIVKFFERESLDLTFKTTVDVTEGQEVVMSNTNEVTKRTTGTKLPIGTVKVPGLAGENITVQTVFAKTVQAIAYGAGLNHGATVKPNGTVDSDGRPQYIIVADGDYCMGVVLSGADSGGEIRVGILRSPVLCANESVS